MGRPETARAVITALGPGATVTGIPLSAHWATKSSPGSEIAGIPASETRAQVSPASILEQNLFPLLPLIVFIIADKEFMDTKMV